MPGSSSSMLVVLVIMILGFWLMSRFARKQQQKMLREQEERLQEALVPGAWVKTRAGFYGKVVEVDGDVVTLSTPLGDESLWAKNSIFGAEEPPFASTEEGEYEQPSSSMSDADLAASDGEDSSSQASDPGTMRA